MLRSRLGWLAAALALLPAAAEAAPRRILFVGNSFTFGSGSAAWKYRAETVTDLNGEGLGGVPALFKRFADRMGLDYQVSHETSGGKSLRWHWENRLALIDQPWDDVILQDFSTLNRGDPGNDAETVEFSGQLTRALLARNAAVKVRLYATWSRADQTYPATGFWSGKPISAMACDVARGYARAAAATPGIAGVVPVGFAWDRAFASGFADPNPYDGIAFGQVSLWTHDQYHASVHGYYLSALTLFGSVTGTDPVLLGKDEPSAKELGISGAQAEALQRIASEQLKAGNVNPRCG